jgi:predicted phosphodiesterase
MWQTAGAADGDRFEAEFRGAGDDAWAMAPVESTASPDSRVNHWVDLTGLDYDRRYEYRIRHLRDGLLQTWTQAFFTRLASHDPRPFVFAAYGDSAWSEELAPFEAVQRAVGASGASFTLLLGDNAYDYGSAGDLDARFQAPISAALLARHVEHVAFGNHDIRDDAGRPSEEGFAAPIPQAGRTASVEPPGSERPEHNYSFDYGGVHFVTFDSNSIDSRSRLEGLLNWVESDLAVSDATWKVVFAHNPVGAVVEHGDELSRYSYYPGLVANRLAEARVDLFLVGHSHTYSWSYPLTGYDDGGFQYVVDHDGSYRQGEGFVQVVAGTGGKFLRPGDFDYPFIVSGFSLDSSPPAQHGFARIQVTSLKLTVEYIAANDGSVLAAFSIVISTPSFAAGRFAI